MCVRLPPALREYTSRAAVPSLVAASPGARGVSSSPASPVGEQEDRHALDARRDRVAALTARPRPRAGQRRDQHRDRRAGLPGARPGARLPGLLRALGARELLLLRRPLLGLRARWLVRQQLVRRSVEPGGPRVRARLPAARPGALLPRAAAVLPRLAARRAAPLGRALRSGLGAPAGGLGPVGSPRAHAPGAPPPLPAAVRGGSLSAVVRAAARAPLGELPLPAARGGGAAAVPAARRPWRRAVRAATRRARGRPGRATARRRVPAAGLARSRSAARGVPAAGRPR